MIFQYNNVPEAILPVIQEKIESCKDYFPSWCQKVVVEYNILPNPDYELTCESQYQYRFIVIIVSEEFFRQKNWREAVLHEIIHATVAPFTAQSWAVVETIVEEGPIRKYLESQLRDAEEAAATDLATLLDKVLTNGSKSLS